MPESPPIVRGAAVVQAAEAVIVAAATVVSGADTASGQSYQRSSGIALTVIGAAAAVVLAAVALGLARAQRWSRTPALLTQVFTGIIGIYLLQGGRLGWGVPSVLLAAAGLAALLSRPGIRAFAGEREAGPPGRDGGPQRRGGR